MGCTSSKAQTVNSRNVSRIGLPVGENNQSVARRNSKAKSSDSGISLGDDDREQTIPISSPTTTSRVTVLTSETVKKGIAFEIPVAEDSIIKSHPPRRFQSHLDSSRKGNLKPIEISQNGSNILRQITEKQVRATQLREQERLSVVARQKRREAKARKVKERKIKLQQDSEIWAEEDLSDVEVDQNFHTSDDYDFMANESDADIATEECDSFTQDKETIVDKDFQEEQEK